LYGVIAQLLLGFGFVEIHVVQRLTEGELRFVDGKPKYSLGLANDWQVCVGLRPTQGSQHPPDGSFVHWGVSFSSRPGWAGTAARAAVRTRPVTDRGSATGRRCRQSATTPMWARAKLPRSVKPLW